jgi:hypothetical protein
MLKEAEKLITDMSHKATDAELPNFLSHTHMQRNAYSVLISVACNG